MRHILITGASSGIGEALAIAYANSDSYLSLLGRNQDRLENVAASCRDKGATVDTYTACVTDKQTVSEWIIRCDDLCPIDLIIANAGVSGTSGDWDDAEALFDINMMGVVHTIHAIAPKMVARGRGQIAVMASLAGYRGLASAPAYAASKAFVKAYGEGLRGKLSPKGVKVNVICPGFVRSRLTDRNNFHMPFLMEADKAADIIVKALDKNKGRISFPWSMTFVVWLLATLPSGITDWITQKLPAKE